MEDPLNSCIRISLRNWGHFKNSNSWMLNHNPGIYHLLFFVGCGSIRVRGRSNLRRPRWQDEDGWAAVPHRDQASGQHDHHLHPVFVVRSISVFPRLRTSHLQRPTCTTIIWARGLTVSTANLSAAERLILENLLSFYSSKNIKLKPKYLWSYCATI